MSGAFLVSTWIIFLFFFLFSVASPRSLLSSPLIIYFFFTIHLHHSFSFFIFHFSLQSGKFAKAGVAEAARLGASAACDDCPIGKYGETLAALTEGATCSECNPGYWSDTSPANHISFCKPCAAGKYSPLAVTGRTTDCNECGPGTYSELAAATAECKECPTGYSQSESARANCSPCLPGTEEIILFPRFFFSTEQFCLIFFFSLTFFHFFRRVREPDKFRGVQKMFER